MQRDGSLIDMGVNDQIIEKSGAWFTFRDIRLGQGRENAKLYLKENPQLAFEVENLIRQKYNLQLINMVEKEG